MINLAGADYTNYLDLSNVCDDEYFDIAFLVFTGGFGMVKAQHQYGQLLSVLSAVHPFLKEKGKFVYMDRIFLGENVDLSAHVDVPYGYELVGINLDENISKVKATYWGNKEITFVLNGTVRAIEVDDSLADGELANAFCEEFQAAGFRQGIVTYVFEKVMT
ncbi:MAG: hypothetical protein U9P44_04150, partial [archaeon]|nr:hypothetical protein [archaeon]